MNSLEGQTLGFVGLGLMGRPMCLNLSQAGARMIVHNRSRGVIDEIRGPGIEAAGSPAEVARCAPTIVLMLTDTKAVEQVLFGADGLVEGLQPGSLVIDMGTTAVTTTREIAARLRRHEVGFIDAPVSGGQIGAVAGTLAIMAGGEPETIERAQPLFEVLGSSFTHVGGPGAGQVAKAANQVIVGLNIGAVAEAIALVESAGVDPAKVRQALMGGFAASRILEVHGQRMIERAFEPGAKITTQVKDLEQAIELGSLLGQRLPATELSLSLYRSLVDRGQGGLDHSALIKALQDEDANLPNPSTGPC
jgi:3-hydroxyisobutyrate dehydrogenase-like beta-hydroxyacid dehydrogenase